MIFLNKACTKFKLLVGNSYLIYYNNGSRRIPLEAISRLPLAFEGREFNFTKALKVTLEEKLNLSSARGKTVILRKKNEAIRSSVH